MVTSRAGSVSARNTEMWSNPAVLVWKKESQRDRAKVAENSIMQVKRLVTSSWWNPMVRDLHPNDSQHAAENWRYKAEDGRTLLPQHHLTMNHLGLILTDVLIIVSGTEKSLPLPSLSFQLGPSQPSLELRGHRGGGGWSLQHPVNQAHWGWCSLGGFVMEESKN